VTKHTFLINFSFSPPQQTSNISATLVLSRPIKGPKTIVLDLEMVTVNNVINFRGSSIIRLTIFVSEHPFWGFTNEWTSDLSPLHGPIPPSWTSCYCTTLAAAFLNFFLFCSVVLDSHVVITLSVCSLVGGACDDLW